MRISDWSSDVCSSDLLSKLQSAGQAMRQGIRDEIQAAANQIFSMAVEQVRSELDSEVRRFQDDIRREVDALKQDIRDRKSVVKGKSVTVRVDLGGRRIFKKTKKIEMPTQNNTN